MRLPYLLALLFLIAPLTATTDDYTADSADTIVALDLDDRACRPAGRWSGVQDAGDVPPQGRQGVRHRQRGRLATSVGTGHP